MSSNWDDALDRARHLITDARQTFLEEVAVVLRDGDQLAGTIGQVIGEISPELAMNAWKREMIIRIQGLGKRRVLPPEENP